MATMNISLTDPLKQFVDEEVREGGYPVRRTMCVT